MQTNDAVSACLNEIDQIVNDNPGAVQPTVGHALLQRTQRMREWLANPPADEPALDVQEPALSDAAPAKEARGRGRKSSS